MGKDDSSSYVSLIGMLREQIMHAFSTLHLLPSLFWWLLWPAIMEGLSSQPPYTRDIIYLTLNGKRSKLRKIVKCSVIKKLKAKE